MAYNFKSEEEVKEYLENLGTEYRFLCFKEKDPEGCHLLANYFEAVSREFDSAARVYQANCNERNFSRSCMKYANCCYLGKGVKQNYLEALEYYKKACELNLPDGCLYTGIMLTKEKKIESNFVEGLKSLEKSCSAGNGRACNYISEFYISGEKGIPQNKTKASEYALKACNGDSINGCMNLSQMYKLGDGVGKDDKKAREFKERAKEIRAKVGKISLEQYT